MAEIFPGCDQAGRTAVYRQYLPVCKLWVHKVCYWVDNLGGCKPTLAANGRFASASPPQPEDNSRQFKRFTSQPTWQASASPAFARLDATTVHRSGLSKGNLPSC